MSTAEPNPPPRHASLAVGARRHGVSTRTVRRLIASGDLRGYRLGPRLIRVDLDELDALLRPIPTAGTGEGRAASRHRNPDVIRVRPEDLEQLPRPTPPTGADSHQAA